MRRRLLVATGIVLAIVAIAVSAGGAYAYFWESGRADVLAAGVTVAGLDVGGLRADQARALLEQRVADPLRRPLRLAYGAHSFVVDPARAGLRVHTAAMVGRALAASSSGGLVRRFLRDVGGNELHVAVPLDASLDRSALARYVDGVARVLDRPARQARVVATADRLRVVPERPGLAVERDRLRAALGAALLDAAGPRTLAIPTRTVMPRWTAATLPRRYPAFLLVDRETFTLRLYRGLRLARTYPIAVGQAGLETPAGLYRIDDKQVNPSWHVPNSAWAGSLAGRVIPPGPSDPIKARWMGFWNGAGIHGTDETWSIGHAASHGCIRMRIPDVIALYALVPLGTPIYVG
jgi:L,D-transpeptidase catalytic domain/Putative peptidoglycan binding domain